MKFFTLIFLFLVMAACVQKVKVDLIVTNTTIYTLDETFSTAESLAISKGKVVAVGTCNEIDQKYEAKNTVDAKGKFVYPGFNDAH